MGIPSEFENLHALVHVGLLGGRVPRNLAQTAILLVAPLSRHLVEERAVHALVEFVEIHGIDAIAEPLVLGLEPPDGVLMLAPLIGVAPMERLPHPFQHFVVEPKLAEHFGKLLLQHLLAHVLAPTICRIPLAFIGVCGAVVIDVALLFALADHRAAAFGAGNQTGEGEIMPAALGLVGVASVENALNPLP